MCKKLQRIMSVRYANMLEERNKRYMYWRTNKGQLRLTGWVGVCACGSTERWASTQRELKRAFVLSKC